MRWWPALTCLFLFACGNEADVTTVSSSASDTHTNTSIQTTDTAVDEVRDTSSHASFTPLPIKTPAGIYRCLLPYGKNTSLVHTVAFYPGNFRLQEEFPGKADSIVVTTGTWAPSQGYIWLYKEQLVRGRYTWRGDTLQYFSPRLKRNFAMEHLAPVMQNKAWQDRKKEGAVLFATGTEPFWSAEVKADSLVLNMPDWPQPLRTKLTGVNKNSKGRVYTADSLSLTVLPYFCSDGMSDFIYTKTITINYKGKTYNGCGELF